MSKPLYYLLAVLVMAGATYIPRALPFALFRKPVQSRFIKSFLEYMPVAVLAAMTFPAIFHSVNNVGAGVIGAIVALILAFCKQVNTLYINVFLHFRGIYEDRY